MAPFLVKAEGVGIQVYYLRCFPWNVMKFSGAVFFR